MYVVIKQYCISGGPCQVLDIISVDKPNEYMIPITAGKWPGGIETKGIEPAQLTAYSLDFPIVDRNLRAKKFKALYQTHGKEFYSIKYDGKKAVLNVLDMSKAQKLYRELPQKALPANLLFDYAAYQVEMENINRDNDSMKEMEKEAAKERKWIELGPTGRFLNPQKNPRDI